MSAVHFYGKSSLWQVIQLSVPYQVFHQGNQMRLELAVKFTTIYKRSDLRETEIKQNPMQGFAEDTAGREAFLSSSLA